MIGLKQILTEVLTYHGEFSGKKSKRRTVINSERFEKAIAGPFSHAAERFLNPRTSDFPIRFADRKSKEPYEFVVPTKYERTSKDAGNLYTVLMSRLPSWKGWPRRSFGLIFFTNNRYSSLGDQYAPYAYRILPRNGAKIAVCSQADVLDSGAMPYLESEYHIRSIQDFLYYMGEGFRLIKKPSLETDRVWQNIKACRYEQYDEVLNLLEENLSPDIIKKYDSERTVSLHNRSEQTIRFRLSFSSWEEYLSDAFDPVKNDFQLTTIEDLDVEDATYEAWTEDPTLMRFYD